MNSLRILVLLILIGVPIPVNAGDKTSERISGVADFLIERANDNYLYIFQRKIQGNQALSCYFPTTYDNLTVGGANSLKRLLTSRDLWKESIQSDLEFLTIRSLTAEIESALHVSDASVRIASSALDLVNFFTLSVNGQEYPLNVIDRNLDPDTLKRINGFTFGLGQVVNDLNKFRKYKSLCPAPIIDMDTFKREFESLRSLNSNFNQWVKHIQLNASDLRIKVVAGENPSWASTCDKLGIPSANCTDGKSTIEAFKTFKLNELINPKILSNINLIKESIDILRNNKEQIVNTAIRDAVCKKLNISDAECTDKHTIIEAVNEIVNASGGDGSNQSPTGLIDKDLLEKIKTINEVAATLPSSDEDVTSQVFKALKKIRGFLESETTAKYERLADEIGKENANQMRIEELQSKIKTFERLSHHILFFSSVADADAASEVKSILANYTLPSVSFFEKRKAGNHFMVSSYLGVSYNIDEDAESEQSNNGMFVPIGLEYSRGVNWLNGSVQSASVMLSPVDFGHPVNLKLNNIEEDFELDEIIAPSLTFALGLKDYPLNFGIGYQKGRQINASSDTEDRFILFFAFDMPLLNLHSD